MIKFLSALLLDCEMFLRSACGPKVLLLVAICSFANESAILATENSAQENVLFYPACGVRAGMDWEVELRLWVYEERALAQLIAGGLASSLGEIDDAQKTRFQKRVRHFLADSETRESVEFSFDKDPQGETFQLTNADGKAQYSDANGNITSVFRLPDERAQELLKAQNSENGWLTIRTASAGHDGRGRIQLISPDGLSIISDIDDTLKITEIPAGAQVVSRNIFLREFVPTTELRSVFEANPEAPVHYVSAGPWQLYEPLSVELIEADDLLPEGTFHMRTMRTNLMTLSSWKDFSSVLFNKEGTLEHKVTEITRLMQRFPARKFLLLGDSGEMDPEVYRRVQETFPGQVQEIIIRDVVNAKELQPDRLKGMTIVPAPTVEPGKSQFDAE
ncbi:MAG: phosphatase domain-containing protein [Planctomycetaceae bacterium]